MQSTFIRIEDLRVDCLIGVWSHERNQKQQIRVDLTVEFDALDAAKHDELDRTLNYADIARDVTFLLEQCQFQLLESAVWMLQRWLLCPTTPHSGHAIRSVDVKLTKFGALPGSTLASVQSMCRCEDLDYVCEAKTWGHVDVIGETPKVGAYRLNIAPGQLLPPHFHHVMREAELVLSPGIEFVGDHETRALQVGEVIEWSRGFVHGYRNETSRFVSLLCIDSPPFIPTDEHVITS